MKKENKILANGILAMLVLNFFGSISSRLLDFNYSYLSPISFIIYGVTAFLITKNKNLKTGVLFAAVLGLAESTIGSMVSKIFGEPNIGDLQIDMTTGLWIVTIISVTIIAAIIGLAGGGLAKLLEKKSTEA